MLLLLLLLLLLMMMKNTKFIIFGGKYKIHALSCYRQLNY
jgi:hypothetical protein